MSKIGKIHVFGKASNRTLTILEVTNNDENLSLLNFLFRYNIPIASSCSGDGVCLKCKVTIKEQTVISCQIKMKDLFQNGEISVIEISYL